VTLGRYLRRQLCTPACSRPGPSHFPGPLLSSEAADPDWPHSTIAHAIIVFSGWPPGFQSRCQSVGRYAKKLARQCERSSLLARLRRGGPRHLATYAPAVQRGWPGRRHRARSSAAGPQPGRTADGLFLLSQPVDRGADGLLCVPGSVRATRDLAGTVRRCLSPRAYRPAESGRASDCRRKKRKKRGKRRRKGGGGWDVVDRNATRCGCRTRPRGRCRREHRRKRRQRQAVGRCRPSQSTQAISRGCS
jgi:hypothetical protein